jgi:formamidopyrimidine-DNA glycosylase
MPELPEVEIARRNLVRWFKGRTLVRVQAEATRVLRGGEAKSLARLGGTLVQAERTGKFLLLHFSQGPGLLVHLGMTGKFVRRPGGEELKHGRVRFLLDSGQVIHFVDPRMFGRILPVTASHLADVPEARDLGVDPWNVRVTGTTLAALFQDSKRPLKISLMDQTKLAGLGNIHAAEALWRAKLDPKRKPQGLSTSDWTRLAKAIRDTLAYGLRVTQGDEVRYVEESNAENPFFVYGKAGTPCRRCRTLIRSFPQGGRTTYACPHCQR